MPLSIIRATIDYVDQLTPLLDGYRQFYKQASDLENGRAFLHERLTNNESVIFLALLDGEAVGFTQLYPLFTTTLLKRMWLLNDLFVAPAGRKQGVGEALLERARQFGIETKAQRLMLKTNVANTTAQKLYERTGWVRETDFYVYNIVL